MTTPTSPPLLVTGDLTVDWTIVRPPDLVTNLHLAYLWDQQGTVSIAAMPGGSALIQALLGELGVTAVLEPSLPAGALSDPRQAVVAKSFTAWSSLPASRGNNESRWRLSEFLGQVPAANLPRPKSLAASRVLVIDDANLGFRTLDVEWASAFPALDAVEEVVVRMVPPIAAGTLWEHLTDRRPERFTLVVTLGDLRREDGAVGQALSWERTASEIVAAVRVRPEFSKVGRIVVTVGLSGAVIVEGDQATLVYDPEHLEGDWEAGRPGMPYGVGSAVVAGVAAELQRGGSVCEGVVNGLSFGRAIHERGLELQPDGMVRVARDSGSAPARESSAFDTQAIPPAPNWTFLGQRASGNFREIAGRALLTGIETATEGVPLERMGEWKSIDRMEIESVRSVRNILREYLGQPTVHRPVSIGAFGPPGSGKSFVIKQLASQLGASGAIRVLEFNLSQFHDEHGLTSAFDSIRDCAVEGKLPLVFWDEFDSTRAGHQLGWLASFLAPMQDGEFFDGSAIRPIGRAVFVFAGGTHSTMESFMSDATSLPGAKATDFLSRLRGFVDVLGPNPSGPNDESFVVRRAVLLGTVLRRVAPQLCHGEVLAIDPGVCSAFLGIDRYLHGARSMQAIVEMSSLAGSSRYTRSNMPAAHQLSLHVDPEQFGSLLVGGGAQ